MVCQGEFPNCAGISLTRSWNKSSESLLTRAVDTRKLWNQYHLNPNPFSPHDRLFLVPLNSWKHLCCGLQPWAVVIVQFFPWKLVMLAAWWCGMLMKGLKSYPSTMEAALALSAAWPFSIGCRSLTREAFSGRQEEHPNLSTWGSGILLFPWDPEAPDSSLENWFLPTSPLPPGHATSTPVQRLCDPFKL